MNFHCTNCGNENGPDSKFCRSCGNQLEKGSGHAVSGFHIKIPTNLSRRTVITAGAIVAIIVVGVIAVPKASTYFAVQKVLGEIPSYESAGDYQKALDALATTDGKWTLSSTRTEISILKTKEAQYLKWQGDFGNVQKDVDKKDYADAKILLTGIEPTYPQYAEVQSKSSDVESLIESGLRADVATSKQAATAAEARAATAAQAKANADASAAAESQTVRDSQAQAAQAAAQATQAAAQTAAQVKRSFRNELTDAYNSVENQAFASYGSAIQYSNAGNSLLAISQMTSAQNVLSAALNSISDLNTRYTGLASGYYQASNNLVNAIGYLSTAGRLLVDSEGTSLDYSSQINSNKNSYLNDMTLVYDFLQNTSY